jgi:hypothetical protein
MTLRVVGAHKAGVAACTEELKQLVGRHFVDAITVPDGYFSALLADKVFSSAKCAASKDYSSTKYSVSDIPVQNIQSVGIFQHKIFSQ